MLNMCAGLCTVQAKTASCLIHLVPEPPGPHPPPPSSSTICSSTQPIAVCFCDDACVLQSVSATWLCVRKAASSCAKPSANGACKAQTIFVSTNYTPRCFVQPMQTIQSSLTTVMIRLVMHQSAQCASFLLRHVPPS